MRAFRDFIEDCDSVGGPVDSGLVRHFRSCAVPLRRNCAFARVKTTYDLVWFPCEGVVSVFKTVVNGVSYGN